MLTNDTKLNYCRNTLGFCCRSHFYNNNNPMGIEECSLLEDAELKQRTMHVAHNSAATEEVVTLACFKPQWDMTDKWVLEAGLVKAPSVTIDLVNVPFPKIRTSVETDIVENGVGVITLMGVTVTRTGDKVKSQKEIVQINLPRYLTVALGVKIQKLFEEEY